MENHHSTRNLAVRAKLRRFLPLVPLATLSLATILGPMAPSQGEDIYQRSSNLYRVCTRDLLKAGITADKGSTACAAALYPHYISKCVTKITKKGAIPANDALFNCTRVRRPLDLADCVQNIKSKTKGAESLSIVNHCRRSLLPLRFSECVVGVSRGLKGPMATEEIMNTCLDARQGVPIPAETP